MNYIFYKRRIFLNLWLLKEHKLTKSKKQEKLINYLYMPLIKVTSKARIMRIMANKIITLILVISKFITKNAIIRALMFKIYYFIEHIYKNNFNFL